LDHPHPGRTASFYRLARERISRSGPTAARITNAREWVQSLSPSNAGPTELMARIQQALAVPTDGDLLTASLPASGFASWKCLMGNRTRSNRNGCPCPVRERRRPQGAGHRRRIHASHIGIVDVGAARLLVGRAGIGGCPRPRKNATAAAHHPRRGRLDAHARRATRSLPQPTPDRLQTANRHARRGVRAFLDSRRLKAPTP